jgi:para-nitrobenzyl esterase
MTQRTDSIFGNVGRREFIGGAAAGLLLPLRAWSESKASPTVEIASGKIRGVTERGVHAFKGIPYGAPTGGANRFMPPKPVAAWTGVRETTAYGLSSPQRDPTAPPRSGVLGGAAALIGDLSGLPEGEECLVLNVWSRGIKSDGKADGGKRPVMFWIHGGGFQSGSGSSPGYDGTNLCLRGDVVVVAINHRLNVVGHSHLSELLGDEFAASGNVGMLDVVQALQWVRTNIERFGGDPNNVMIFGESGGGRKVSVLQAMPSAQGLYHRAVVQSGPGIHMLDRATAHEVSELLLRELGIDKSNARQLQSTPIDQLLIAYHKVARQRPGTLGSPFGNYAPVVDGKILPQHPFSPMAPAISADIPLLIGSNRTEATLFNLGDRALPTLDEAGLQQRIAKLFKDGSAALIDTYRKQYPNATPGDLFIYIETDGRYGVPTKILAERKAALNRGPVYVYRFDWATPVMGGRLQSPHALEIPFAFDRAKESSALTGGTPEAVALADKVSDAWIAFARTGNPNVSKLPKWPVYDVNTRATMLFDIESKVVNDPQKETRVAMEAALKLA